MKTIYIPKGETIRYESLATEHLVVHGCLQVTCGITAKTITGYGTVHAGTVNADVIRVDDMDAGSIVCKRLLAKRVQSPEVFASESAAVQSFRNWTKRPEIPSMPSKKRIFANGRKTLPNWSGAARNSRKPARRLLRHCAVRSRI